MLPVLFRVAFLWLLAITTVWSDEVTSRLASTPKYVELVMQAQCQARCLKRTGEMAFSSDVTLLPVYSCSTEKCRQCSAPCDTDIINLVSPTTCIQTKCVSDI